MVHFWLIYWCFAGEGIDDRSLIVMVSLWGATTTGCVFVMHVFEVMLL